MLLFSHSATKYFRMQITLTENDLRELNMATFDAYIKSGKYALTYVQASEQFGRANIDLLLSNKLLEDKGSYKAKKRFYIPDIVAGLEILRRNEKDR